MRICRGAAIFACLLLALFVADIARAVDAAANVKDAIVPPTPPSGPLEQTPLKFSHNSSGVGATPTTQTAAPAGSSSSKWDIARIPLALGAVVLLILGLRSAGKRLAGTRANKGAGRGVQVLSRSIVAPRQQMLVVQFGRRLLLVGSSGAEMTPLCQLDDPDEVAEVLAQLKSDRGATSKSFLTTFRGADSAYEADEPAVAAATSRTPPATTEDAAEPQSGEDLSGLMARIRRMSEQFQQST
jgi:flagellar biogenesis protein FliO